MLLSIRDFEMAQHLSLKPARFEVYTTHCRRAAGRRSRPYGRKRAKSVEVRTSSPDRAFASRRGVSSDGRTFPQSRGQSSHLLFVYVPHGPAAAYRHGSPPRGSYAIAVSPVLDGGAKFLDAGAEGITLDPKGASLRRPGRPAWCG